MTEPNESDRVPPSVREHVKRSLDTLRSIQARLLRARWLDDKFAGNGRYESEAYEALLDEAQGWLGVIEQFRTAAAQQGVDAAQVIKELGGLSNLDRSERAARYAAAFRGVA